MTRDSILNEFRPRSAGSLTPMVEVVPTRIPVVLVCVA
jgi:hypothetical protein